MICSRWLRTRGICSLRFWSQQCEMGLAGLGSRSLRGCPLQSAPPESVLLAPSASAQSVLGTPAFCLPHHAPCYTPTFLPPPCNDLGLQEAPQKIQGPFPSQDLKFITSAESLWPCKVRYSWVLRISAQTSGGRGALFHQLCRWSVNMA